MFQQQKISSEAKVIQVQFAPWDKIYNFNSDSHKLKTSDQVIVKTELGIEIGEIIGIKSIENFKAIKELKPILRKANLSDIEKVNFRNKNRAETLKTCRNLIKKYNLPAKLIDVKFSFDGGRITFAFTAPERIDFRNLVKELTGIFHKSIRLQQIGVREEAKIMGGIGPCGRELCCLKFLKNLGNISTDFIFDQQLNHRGAERLSGSCGRLYCCLAYNEPMYKELANNLPALGSIIKTEKGKGKVVGRNILKQTIKVEIDNGNFIEIPFKK
ncbi:MAG: PSP1 domain protein [Parcubacteria group bacterium Athens1014_10]|nr:MAG: PSP1 domain protein [Parcubacteria group bacterium Athens1014_10]TSD06075.1 MAG: PSP1 domain protein [Parcubacteria group bacterium Athens0714_12]